MNITRFARRGLQPKPVRGSTRRARALLAGLAGLAMASAALTAGVTGASAAAASSSPSGSTLRIQAQTAFSTFNPFTAYFDGDLEVINNIYPQLTAINAQGVAGPYLATKWNISADRLPWPLTASPVWKWPDAKPITAADA